MPSDLYWHVSKAFTRETSPAVARVRLQLHSRLHKHGPHESLLSGELTPRRVNEIVAALQLEVVSEGVTGHVGQNTETQEK